MMMCLSRIRKPFATISLSYTTREIFYGTNRQAEDGIRDNDE